MQVNVVIEIPQGSDVKYEIDHKTGKIYVDRFLYAAAHYPFNYGFIEGTAAPDGDPLDCLVISREAVTPVKNEIEHFFNHYKELEPEKFVKVLGWMNRKEAEETVKSCSVG